MSRCTYTWEEWDWEEREYIKIQCPEETWSGSEEYCIFHDPSPEKDTVLFKQKLKEKLKKKDYNFTEYHFPESIDFEDIEFKGSAHFSGAIFQYVYFNRVIFKKDAKFIGTTFQENAYFNGTTFEYADFEGAAFLDEALFYGATFQKDAKFIGTTFQVYADFSEATFQRVADFEVAAFPKKADFMGATFQEDAYFCRAAFQEADFNRAIFHETVFLWDATFQKDASFWDTTFQDANFSGATFEKNVEFAPKDIEELNLRNTRFLFRGNITTNLRKTRFHRAYLENVAFIDCEWPDKIYEEEHMKDEDINLTFKELETIYRDLKQNMQRHGDYLQAGKFYYREMECRKEAMREKKLSLDFFKSFGYFLLKYTCGYGEKPERTALVSAAAIFTFAFVYGISGCLRYTVLNPCLGQQIKDSIYFSFVTFTTLGLGDIRPLNDLGKLLICCEAVIGAFLIALFVVVFARKMMR